MLLGPLADDGPLTYEAGDVRILGQTMGRMAVSVARQASTAWRRQPCRNGRANKPGNQSRYPYSLPIEFASWRGVSSAGIMLQRS